MVAEAEALFAVCAALVARSASFVNSASAFLYLAADSLANIAPLRSFSVCLADSAAASSSAAAAAAEKGQR